MNCFWISIRYYSMALPALLAVCLTTYSLLGTCSAQDVDKVNQRYLEAAAHHDLLLKNDSVKLAYERVRQTWDMKLTTQLTNAGNAVAMNISEECQEAFRYLDIQTIFRLVDATGKLPAGILGGNTNFDGAYDECLDMEDTAYCIASVTIKALPKLPLPWKLGACLPSDCASDFKVLFWELGVEKVVDPTKTMAYCASTKNPPLNVGAIVMICVCIVFLLFATIGTILDVTDQFWNKTRGNLRHYLLAVPDSSARKEGNELEISDKTPLLNKTVVKDKPSRFNPIDLIKAFSMSKNISTILSTEQPPSAITSLNGMRVISMFWVILCHSHMWPLLGSVDNTLKLKDVLSRFSFQAIANAFFSVDSFFFLSGLLVAYLTLRQMARRNGRFPLIPYYLHRYLRLTPTYAFVLFFIWLLSMHLGDGPYYAISTWPKISLQWRACSKYWWTNLLYINNLYPWKLGDECIGWTWYLANDMQFFIIAPLIIIPMYFLFPLGLAVAGVLLVICFIVTGALTGVYNFQANSFALFAYNYTTNVTESAQDYLYIKPWHRISPYLVGLVLGYLLYRKARVPLNRLLNYIVYSIVWILAGVCLVTTLYGLYFTWHGHIPTLAENVMYFMLSRFVWAVGLALVVFACHNGYGGVVNSFLSMKIWIPLSRLSYNAYLLHPMILTLVFGAMRKSLHYTELSMVVYGIANIMLSFGAAAVVSVFVEFPLGNVEQVLFKLFGVGGRESTRRGTDADKTVNLAPIDVKQKNSVAYS